ncbi:hypothetical protein D4R71_00470 [bacterium]|nr:MAG: hypothetical protein D4R71_00470 [bacterium]
MDGKVRDVVELLLQLNRGVSQWVNNTVGGGDEKIFPAMYKFLPGKYPENDPHSLLLNILGVPKDTEGYPTQEDYRKRRAFSRDWLWEQIANFEDGLLTIDELLKSIEEGVTYGLD